MQEENEEATAPLFTQGYKILLEKDKEISALKEKIEEKNKLLSEANERIKRQEKEVMEITVGLTSLKEEIIKLSEEALKIPNIFSFLSTSLGRLIGISILAIVVVVIIYVFLHQFFSMRFLLSSNNSTNSL